MQQQMYSSTPKKGRMVETLDHLELSPVAVESTIRLSDSTASDCEESIESGEASLPSLDAKNESSWVPSNHPSCRDDSDDMSHYGRSHLDEEDIGEQQQQDNESEDNAERIKESDGVDDAEMEDLTDLNSKLVIVDVEKLDELLGDCRKCPAKNNIFKKKKGAMLTYECVCEGQKHHKFTWRTSKIDRCNLLLWNRILGI
jgi:hypothetical protein